MHTIACYSNHYQVYWMKTRQVYTELLIYHISRTRIITSLFVEITSIGLFWINKSRIHLQLSYMTSTFHLLTLGELRTLCVRTRGFGPQVGKLPRIPENGIDFIFTHKQQQRVIFRICG